MPQVTFYILNRSIYSYKTQEPFPGVRYEEKPLKAQRNFLVQSETPEGPSQEIKEPEEKNEENNSILLSHFLGQGLIDFLISRPST